MFPPFGHVLVPAWVVDDVSLAGRGLFPTRMQGAAKSVDEVVKGAACGAAV